MGKEETESLNWPAAFAKAVFYISLFSSLTYCCVHRPGGGS